jgi:hypothetical protein
VFAEGADFAVAVAAPADGEEDEGDVGAGDGGLEFFDAGVGALVEPDDLVEAELFDEGVFGVSPSFAADKDDFLAT